MSTSGYLRTTTRSNDERSISVDDWSEAIGRLRHGSEMLAALGMARRLVDDEPGFTPATVAATIRWVFGLTADETATVMARLDEELALASAFDLRPEDIAGMQPFLLAA